MKLFSTSVCLLASLGEVSAFTLKSSPACTRTSGTKCDGTLDGKTIENEFKPTNNMVLVKLNSVDKETAGGLLLTSKKKTKKNEGTVMSVGPGKINQESGFAYDMPLAPGDSVIYDTYGGSEINYNGDPHVLIPDDVVLVKHAGTLTMESVTLLRDSLLVFVEETKEEEIGGILIAKSTSGKTKKSIGEVIKVGPGRLAMNGVLMEMEVEVGDMIKFRKLAGSPVEIEGKEFSVIRMSDVLCKF